MLQTFSKYGLDKLLFLLKTEPPFA